MALSALQKGVASMAGLASRRLLNQVSPFRPQVATIISKARRDQDYVRPAPYDYTKKEYGVWEALFDDTTKRFDENTKVILVEGPMAAGKTKVAKALAEELDMLYIPHVTTDMFYINRYGYDLRVIDHLIPEKVRSFSMADFLKNPNDSRTVLLQMKMYQKKMHQYIKALVHVLSTGQGVVMDRSVFSDFVFMETLYKFGFIHSGAQTYYHEARKATLPQLMRPHLVVYLDVPVDVCLQRIKERSLPGEENSPFYAPQVLSHMETLYKQEFLKDIGQHAEVVVYDWSNYGDTEVIVEDLERIDFDHYVLHSPMMKDWMLEKEGHWCEKRMEYAKNGWTFDRWMCMPLSCCPEIILYGADAKQYTDALQTVPGEMYDYGFNEDCGDSNILLKSKPDIY